MANPASSSPLSSTSTDPIVLLNLPIATKLTRNNFLAWQSQIVPLLHGYDLFRNVDSPSPPDPTLTSGDTVSLNPAYLTWRKQDQLLLGWLRSSLSEPLLAQVVSCTTSADLWSLLHRTFSATSQARLVDLQQQLQGITKGGLTCAEYIQKLRSLADELAFIGSPVSDRDLINYTLRGLGSEFTPLVLAVTARSEPISLRDLHALLLTTENRLTSLQISPSLPAAPDPAAFYANNRPRNPRLVFPYQPASFRPYGSRPPQFPRPNTNYNPRPNNNFNPRPNNNFHPRPTPPPFPLQPAPRAPHQPYPPMAAQSFPPLLPTPPP